YHSLLPLAFSQSLPPLHRDTNIISTVKFSPPQSLRRLRQLPRAVACRHEPSPADVGELIPATHKSGRVLDRHHEPPLQPPSSSSLPLCCQGVRRNVVTTTTATVRLKLPFPSTTTVNHRALPTNPTTSGGQSSEPAEEVSRSLPARQWPVHDPARSKPTGPSPPVPRQRLDNTPGSRPNAARCSPTDHTGPRVLSSSFAALLVSCVKGHTGELAHFGLCFLSKLVHLLVSIWYLLVGVVDVLESYLIAFGWRRKYRSLDINKVRYLAIVVESEDANQISNVIRLLQWAAAMGIKKVCLYDMEGVLKKSKDAILSKCNADLSQGFDVGKLPSDGSRLTLEFTSLPDGKEGVAKAANYLFMKHLELKSNGEIMEKPNFTESLMDEALKVVGCTGPDSDLLLVYGPARCHLGYPPWRMRYTEIVHMGPLKSMKYGSLIKVVRKFTTVRQNYGVCWVYSLAKDGKRFISRSFPGIWNYVCQI
ncbi:Dehydrodolichyl diphosphate synthase complex subunit NUS1-like protein, partial [Drosera capensis]